MKNNALLIEILKNQVVPALGCTEPGAVALAVARAKELLGEPVRELRVSVDKNILKNGMDVGIPGTNERGIVFAAALALIVGRSEYGLEGLRDVSDEDIAPAMEWVASKKISLSLDDKAEGLTIGVDAKGDTATSRVLIRNAHTNIVYEDKNGKPVKDVAPAAAPQESAPPANQVKMEIKKFSVADLIEFANTVPYEDIAFITDGIDMNMRIAKVGVSEKLGIGMGRFFMNRAEDVASRAKALTAAASEARMAGWPLPVMSSAGSGNHGLVAILPIAVVGEGMGCPKEQIVRAVTLSHLVTSLVKVYLGALSPVCGCGVAAGVGCAAGLVLLQGGGCEQVCGAIDNMLAGIAGMLCDGAKLGCSYKLSISVDAAVDAARMALEGIRIPSDNGILGATAEESIQNLAKISNVGMNNTDSIILDVMLRKCQ